MRKLKNENIILLDFHIKNRISEVKEKMILVCKDFKFDNNSLSKQNLISVNFDDDTSLPSALNRDMESSEMNKYRPERIGFGTVYTDVLTFDIHIIKNDFMCKSQEEMEFTNEEYETLVSWLTSPHENIWINITKENGETALAKGYFSSVEPYENWGICYGAKCTFMCNSPYTYEDKTITKQIQKETNFILSNNSSEKYDYVYPILHIVPTKKEEIYIHNLSDSAIVDTAILSSTDNPVQAIADMKTKIENYAKVNNLKVEYVIDPESHDIKMICDNTCVFLYMTDIYGIKKKYVAYYLKNEKQYFLCQGGFFYCELNMGLNIDIDCKTLGIYDSIKRPVLFTKLGIQDEDEIYWMRLINGNNSFRVFGNFELTVNYLEPKKGGLIS